MRLFLIRHAIAEDRDKFDGPDELRPLTEKGRKRAKKTFQGLHSIYPAIHTILYSPAIRAVETAKILSREFPEASQIRSHRLAIDANDWSDLFEQVAQAGDEVALVGHEPNLSQFAGYLLKIAPPFELKKSGIAIISRDHFQFRLDCILTPKISRGLA